MRVKSQSSTVAVQYRDHSAFTFQLSSTQLLQTRRRAFEKVFVKSLLVSFSKFSKLCGYGKSDQEIITGKQSLLLTKKPLSTFIISRLTTSCRLLREAQIFVGSRADKSLQGELDEGRSPSRMRSIKTSICRVWSIEYNFDSSDKSDARRNDKQT